MKKVFLLVLTLASTNILFGARPYLEKTYSQTTNSDHHIMQRSGIRRVAKVNDLQKLLHQAPQRVPAPQQTATRTPRTTTRVQRDLFANILVPQDMETQTLPLRHTTGTQTQHLTNAAHTDRSVDVTAAAVIMTHLRLNQQ